MSPILRNILAVLAGIIIGWIVNMGIVMFSGSIVPPPEGVDPSDIESLKAGMELMKPKHFILPFLAHALGTLAGAFTVAKLAATNKSRLAMVVGLFFLLGGIATIFMIPGPIWFHVLDLAIAYVPMAWLGAKWAK